MSLPRRPLGRTGLDVPPLGFGAFKIGRNTGTKYAQQYELPDDAAVRHLLEGVLDLGMCLIDTAPAYGLSEERIGRAISARRNEFVLSTKVGESFAEGVSTHDFSAQGVRASIDRSLRRLKTDVLDIVLLHSDGRDEWIQNETGAVAELQSQKQAGKVRAIGLSGKQPAGAALALAWADVLMIEYHADDTSHAAVLADAHRAGVGVLVKKGLASGRLAPEVAIPFVLANPAVQSLIVGGLNLIHIQHNVHLAAQARGATIA